MANCKQCLCEQVCRFNDGHNLYCQEDYECPHYHYKSTMDVVGVVRCGKCKHSKPIDTKVPPYKYYRPECVMCYCEEVVGDEPAVYLPTHFCSFGKRKTD